jgi:hypothetical protein
VEEDEKRESCQWEEKTRAGRPRACSVGKRRRRNRVVGVLLALELALEGQQAAGLAPWPEVAPARWGSAASVIESGLVARDHLSSDYASVMRADSTEWHTYTSIFSSKNVAHM